MTTYRAKRVETPDWTKIEAVELAHQPWLKPCAIEAKAQLCHDGENIYVRMEAKEANIRAEETGPLAMACKDSCLEFFYAPKAEDARYLNFEISAGGVLYIGFGAERKTRVRLMHKDPAGLLQPKIGRTADGWTLEYQVPMSFVRMFMPDAQLCGEAACNFYKCGDLTETVHYMAWSPMTSEKPDFHRRQDFGRLIFE